MFRSIGILCGLIGLLGLSCEGPPPPPEPEPALAPFSGARAWEHLKALAEIGSRSSGTPGNEAARNYIRSQLEALGLGPIPLTFDAEVAREDGETETLGFEGVRAVIEGESEDIVVLAAPFDSKHFESFTHVGVNNGASGAALLLELARDLTSDPLPYTVWLAFLDGEDARPEQRFLGSRALVGEIQEGPGLEHLRLVVYFNQVADRDLVLARDLHSDGVVRRMFRRAARKLGHESAFPADVPFTRPPGGHLVFLSAGFRRVMIVIDDRFGGDEAPGIYWQTEEDTLEQCDPASLEIVGSVSLLALRDITALFRKVDRFSHTPVPAPEAESAESVSEEERVEAEESAATPAPTAPPEEEAPLSP